MPSSSLWKQLLALLPVYVLQVGQVTKSITPYTIGVLWDELQLSSSDYASGILVLSTNTNTH